MTAIMGFLAQCEVCPQKAVLTDQQDGWVCPRCAEVAEPQGIRTDRLTAEKGQRTIAEISRWVDHMMAKSGFGDVDVAQAEPTIQPQPLTIPASDPLATAIIREVAQRPDRPLITALVGGRTFQFGGYTQTRGEPLETVWINEADLRLPPTPITHYPWGAPIDEPELPYKPPAKDHVFRAPVVPMSQGLIDDNEAEGRKLGLHINGALAAELLDDNVDWLRGIQG